MDGAAYVWAVPSVIARGTIRSVDASRALALPGVLAVITPDNAPRLPGTGDPELALFQTRAVAYRGQFVAAAVAGTLEVAREAAGRVVIEYEQAAHDVTLTADHPGLYKPELRQPPLRDRHHGRGFRRCVRRRRGPRRRHLPDPR